MLRPALTRVAVVVPAHNEEQLLPACMDALRVAAARSPLPVDVMVVLDACDDGSLAVARSAGVHTLAIDERNVGAARAAGAAAVLTDDTTWLACTDADTRVEPDWLVRQLAHADRGADVVTGTVHVDDWQEWPPETTDAFLRAYRRQVRGQRHSHVHGANLGLSAHAYRRAGGFSALGVGEDRALVRAAVRAGLRIVRATDVRVLTSARRRARADGGFSTYLHDLPAG